jgi:outer membrane protein assembly factor BamE (lipoprotein component of BamABCDE complex)
LLSRQIRIIAILIGAFLWSGCISVKVGRLPDKSALEEKLKPGQSTKRDVLQALGAPRGGGKMMLPIEPGPRDLWYYYYEEGTLSEDQRIFLYVFFKEDIYDGYLWFSSLPQ